MIYCYISIIIIKRPLQTALDLDCVVLHKTENVHSYLLTFYLYIGENLATVVIG